MSIKVAARSRAPTGDFTTAAGTLSFLAGFQIIDLGKDVAPEAFVDAAINDGAAVIGMSTLLTTTAPMMQRVVEILEERGLGDSIKTIAGGAPVSQELVDQIGADAYGYDAANAVESVKALTGASTS